MKFIPAANCDFCGKPGTCIGIFSDDARCDDCCDHAEDRYCKEMGGRLSDCASPDCWCYPYYGGAPGSDFAGPTTEDYVFTDKRAGETKTVPAGTFAFARQEAAPRETWPQNFREDPDCPGLGTWFCPVCLYGVDVPK